MFKGRARESQPLIAYNVMFEKCICVCVCFECVSKQGTASTVIKDFGICDRDHNIQWHAPNPDIRPNALLGQVAVSRSNSDC